MYEDTNATLDLIDQLLAEEREQFTGHERAEFMFDAEDADVTLREIPAACV